MRKALVIVVILLALIPVLPYIIPKEITMDRLAQEFEARNLSVAHVKQVDPPGKEADAHWSMTVNGCRADLYKYTDPGTIAKQHEYNRKDAGTAIVETWGLAESLGAAPNPNVPTYIGRNKMHLFIIATPDEALGHRVIAEFMRL